MSIEALVSFTDMEFADTLCIWISFCIFGKTNI